MDLKEWDCFYSWGWNTNSVREAPPPPTALAYPALSTLLANLLDQNMLISSRFNLHFPDYYEKLSIFSYVYGNLHFLLGELLTLILDPYIFVKLFFLFRV